MIDVELRKWDYIKDQKEWELFKNSLTDEERSLYHTFMSYRSHLSKTEKKIDKLNKDLELQKDKKRDYLKKLTELNHKMDYLRKEFDIGVSVSPWKHNTYNNWYCLGSISRGNKVNLPLGNMKIKVRPHLLEYYKTNYRKKKLFNSQDLDTSMGRNNFCFNITQELQNPKYKIVIREYIRKNPKIKTIKTKVGLDLIFPLKPKGVSIPIMITNKMRMSLSTLGYSRDEMKHLTPIESHEIINKGVPKKPSVERSRSQ